MPSPKALILQGILGVAGLCASGAGGIGLGLGKTFMGVQGDAPAAVDSSLPKPEALENTGEVVEEEGNLGIPEECDATCVLSAEQLKNLKFEKKGDEEIKFDGQEDSDEFELIIEESRDQINYPKGKKYILKPKTIGGQQVTIKGIKEGDIVLESGKEVVIRETSSGRKLEHLLEEVTELGIPKRCVGEQAAQPCELTKLQLQKLNFETRRREAIGVEGQNEGNIVTLTIEDKKDDLNNYPRGKKYSLRSSGYVTIGGVKEGDIFLESGKEVLIRETSGGGKLEHLIEEVNELGIPKRCVGDQAPKPCELIQRQLKDLKFEAKEGASITVDGQSENSTFELIIEDKKDDGDNYPQGKKYTIKAKTGKVTIQNVKEGDIHIWDGKSVVIREKQEGGKLEMAPVEVDELGIPKDCTPGKSCSLNEYQIKNLKFETREGSSITVELLNKAKVVNLKVENRQDDTDNYPKGKKYILSVGERGGQVKIKGLKDGDIEIGSKEVVIREKETGGKLERAPEEINNLGIPRSCKSDQVSAETKTCQLTKGQFERLKFENGGVGSSIIFSGLSESSTFELTFKTTLLEPKNYPKGKKYTLKAKTGTVTIGGVKGGNVVLEQNKAVVFREIKTGNKLETTLDILGIPKACGAEEVKSGSAPKTCEFTAEELKNLKFKAFEEKTGDATVTGLTGEEKIKLTISWSEDKNNYPNNKKYSFDNTKEEDIKIIKEGEEVTIANKKETWFKNDGGKLDIAEIKDKGQIKKEDKLAEVKRILKQLGFEGLSTSIEFDGDSENPTKHSQKSISFSNERDLKKIQFKEFMGGAETVDSLGVLTIKVFLDWERDESKFPKNMKFSFENQYFSSPGFGFRRGNKSVNIAQKKSGTPMPTFKAENLGGKWYLVRS